MASSKADLARLRGSLKLKTTKRTCYSLSVIGLPIQAKLLYLQASLGSLRIS